MHCSCALAPLVPANRPLYSRTHGGHISRANYSSSLLFGSSIHYSFLQIRLNIVIVWKSASRCTSPFYVCECWKHKRTYRSGSHFNKFRVFKIGHLNFELIRVPRVSARHVFIPNDSGKSQIRWPYLFIFLKRKYPSCQKLAEHCIVTLRSILQCHQTKTSHSLVYFIERLDPNIFIFFKLHSDKFQIMCGYCVQT